MSERKRGIMYNLGAFLGGVMQGIKADPEAERKVIKVEREQETRDTPRGRVTLRRTTVEEIEVQDSDETRREE